MATPNYKNFPSGKIYMFTNNTHREYELHTDFLTALQNITTAAALGNRSVCMNMTLGIIEIPKEKEPKNTELHLEQTVIIRKDGQRLLHVNETITEKDTIRVLNSYNWINPDLKFLRCPFCGKQPNYVTNTKKNKAMHGIRCTDGCFRQTHLFDQKTEALESWSNGEIYESDEVTMADKEIKKWIILKDPISEKHDRYYIGDPAQYLYKNIDNNWKEILNEAGFSGEYPENAIKTKPNAEDIAGIFDDSMEDRNHHYLTSMFSGLYHSICTNLKYSAKNETIINILKDTYNSFVKCN